MPTQQQLIKVPEFYLNPPQMRMLMGRGKISVAFCARGTGKTRGITAPSSYNNMALMPRSLNLLGCKSYDSVLDNILPGVRAFLEQNVGLTEKIDYWIGEKPPASLKIPNPYYPISNYDHA